MTSLLLLDSEKKIDSIFQEALNAIALCDDNGCILVANKAFIALFDIKSPDELQQLKLCAKFGLQQDYKSQARADGSVEFETSFVIDTAKIDNVKYLHIRMLHVATDINQYILHIQDITAQKKLKRDGKIDLALQKVHHEVSQMQKQEDWGDITIVLQNELKDLIDYDGLGINIIDIVHDRFYTWIVNPDGLAKGTVIEKLPCSLLQLSNSDQPIYRRNRHEMAYYGDNLGSDRHSVIDVPFLGGSLALNSIKENAFTAYDIKVLQQFADVISEAHYRLQDIVKRDEMEKTLEYQRVQVIQADHLKVLGELAAGITHEINQPLTGIRAFAESALFSIKQDWSISRQEIQTIFADIVTQVDRITDIASHLRIFLREQDINQPKLFRLDDVLDNVLKLFGSQLQTHGIEIQKDIPDDIPECLGWSGAIEQVLFNLISNAKDSLNDRLSTINKGQTYFISSPTLWKPIIKLDIKYRPLCEQVLFTITDNGNGIAEDVISHIFEPFYTTKPIGKGTGLGLSISKGIVDQHNGLIRVSSAIHNGATFTVALPVAQPLDSLVDKNQ